MVYANIMSRLVDAPLWLHPAKASAIYNALCGRFGHLPIDPQASRFAGEWPQSEDSSNGRRRSEPFRLTSTGVGVVTVTGTLINRGAWVGSHSGLTSYEGIKHQLARAAADSRVKSIILDLDTPGGEAAGAFEAASAVRAAAQRKPVIAVANGMAASAGYALASGATKIISAPSGVAGSIGTVLIHLDYSRALDDEGITPTLIVAGRHKADGNAVEPLTDETLATLRREVDKYYELFVETVAQGRGRATPASIARGTEGRVYIGRDAVDARLADDVGTFEEVLGDLGRRAARLNTNLENKKVTGSKPRSKPMIDLVEEDQPEEKTTATTTLTEEQFIKLIPDKAADEAAGEAKQIARFKAIAADPRVKGREAFALKLACEAPSLPPDSIAALCAEVPLPALERISLEARAKETGVDGISSAPVPDLKAQRTRDAWNDAIEKTNARTLKEVPHFTRR